MYAFGNREIENEVYHAHLYFFGCHDSLQLWGNV